MTKFFLSLGIFAAFGGITQLSFGGSDAYSSGRVPTFTLDQAIVTALQQNPTLLNAEQEIKRTKGVIIQVRAQALPQINARANYDWTDPNLEGSRIFGNTNTITGTTPGTATAGATSLMEAVPSQVGNVQVPLADPSPTPNILKNAKASDVSYAVSVLGSQLIFNGTTFPQIRGTFFQRDSAY
ncbi:MAG: TolC family protein, partial [Candidatus Udaeobacter sp.]